MPIKTGAPASLRALQYRRRYCVQLEEFMGRGYSFTAFAGEIGTSRANLLRWCEEHSPFAKALERGQARRVRLLEERLLAADGRETRGAQAQTLKAAEREDRGARPASAGPARAGLARAGLARIAPRTSARPRARTADAVSFEPPDNGRD
ncbi:hypothetical protein [Caulobacter sp. S45]|uniref:hypothetical protein n=1 Tax=Caulobacter sp. S45 TaxID=1641861 RepID=UPI001575AC62|nr:hypothetical protein [Caulobacter sp. S45]